MPEPRTIRVTNVVRQHGRLWVTLAYTYVGSEHNHDDELFLDEPEARTLMDELAQALCFGMVSETERDYWKRKAEAAEEARNEVVNEVQRLRRELHADLALWEGMLEHIPEQDAMHALLGLRLASIRTTLGGTADA